MKYTENTWKMLSMILRYAIISSRVRVGGEVLDQLQRENSTILTQWGIAPSGSTA